jgi:hypothetical protein
MTAWEWGSQEEYELQFNDIFEQFLAFDRGQPIAMVNPEALKG